MAQKLHTEYGFSYDNLKVLLGGWFAWQDANTQNPTAYPIEVSPGSSSSNNRDSLIEGWLKPETWLR